ncbi:hypothetical protein HOG16_03925 [Candidatus Woesearchaeota archaeon]|jgi:hypothetical protein|nr:hypothetical protein [Candidatus Woesearchaeota archaeon]
MNIKNNLVNSEDILHIKFKHDELVRSKKDFLSSQIELLQISREINNFKIARAEELDTKLLLNKEMKSFNLSLRKLQASLPKVKIPKILSKEIVPKPQTIQRPQTYQQPTHNSTIESELLEIQNRLKELG